MNFIDSFNRPHNYLRISLTDSCNLRCHYCMPEQVHFMPHANLMSADEIVEIASIFVKHGINKIRLTGGEPLVRQDGKEIMKRLSRLPITLTLTTNGCLIDQYLETFIESGIHSVNVSLDTLQAKKFETITRRNSFDKVWNHIQLLLDHNFHVKINCVAMKGINDDEVLDFVELTKNLPLHIRFIEFMPFSGNRWEHASVYPYQEIIDHISAQFSILKLKDEKHDTTKKFKVFNHVGTFSVISTMSAPFCEGCNRLRLTADGKMKNCLFSTTEVSLLDALRNGQDLLPLIQGNLKLKEKQTGGQLFEDYSSIQTDQLLNRSMVKIGG